MSSPFTGPVFSQREERHVHVGDGNEARVPEGMSELQLLALLVTMVAVAYAFPFKAIKYALIVAFAALFFVQTMRRPAMGLALLAFGVPVIDLVPPGLIPIRGMNAETMLALSLFFIWWRANALYGKSELRSLLGLSLGIYALLIAVSCAHSWFAWRFSLFDLFSGAKNHLTYMLFLPVAFHVLRTRRDQILLIGAASLAVLLSSVQAIEGSWLSFVTGSLERNRATSIFAIQPNILGSAIGLYLPVFLMLAIHRIGSKGARFYFLISAGAAAFALLLTLSRGSWLGVGFGLFVIAVYRSHRLLIFILLLAASYQVWVPQQVVERVVGTREAAQSEYADPDQIADGSTQMRIEQYKSLPAMMKPRPILGWGYGSYPRIFERYGTLGRPKGAHSTYCLLGTEEGLIGLVILGFVFWAQLWIAFRASRELEDPMYRWMAVGLIGGTLAMMVAMGSGSRFETQKIFVYHWVFLGIIERELRLMELRAAEKRQGKIIGLRPQES